MKSGGKSILKLTVAGSLSAQPDKARLQPQAATVLYPRLESCALQGCRVTSKVRELAQNQVLMVEWGWGLTFSLRSPERVSRVHFRV